MALLERTDTLAAIRAKVEAGERLDFDDGVALMESDDLLGLGDLADFARRQRGGDDRVFFGWNASGISARKPPVLSCWSRRRSRWSTRSSYVSTCP